ncbi:MAG: VOC family protein [Candidatus Lokiarchaeota archaeon]|nr:VOC family protein [Candidatus Lokiarchaeota archaeon]
MAQNFTFNLGNLKIDQMSFVYKDIKKQAKKMEQIYSIPTFAQMENITHQEATYRGKEVTIIIDYAFSRLLNIQIELQQWKSGDSLFKEFIDQGKEGLHSIGVYVEDLDAYIDEFKKRGIEVLQTGQIGKQKFVYLDTRQTFGVLLEISTTVKRRRKK